MLAEHNHEVQVIVGQVYLVTALHVQGADDPTRVVKRHTDLRGDAGDRANEGRVGPVILEQDSLPCADNASRHRP